jgi:predicted nucleic acid-binding protein
MTAVDTNVFIYACDKGEPRRQKIALDLIAGIADGVLPWQVACRVHLGFPQAECAEVHSGGRLGATRWLPVVFRLVVPSPAVLPLAQDLHLKHSVSFWPWSLRRRLAAATTAQSAGCRRSAARDHISSDWSGLARSSCPAVSRPTCSAPLPPMPPRLMLPAKCRLQPDSRLRLAVFRS